MKLLWSEPKLTSKRRRFFSGFMSWYVWVLRKVERMIKDFYRLCESTFLVAGFSFEYKLKIF